MIHRRRAWKLPSALLGAAFLSGGGVPAWGAVQTFVVNSTADVANSSPTSKRRESRSVVFRVDVEDRSEPGGTNGPPPPDRYRIRIWFVAPDTSDGLTLRQEVACANPITEEVTASTPDIDDGGDLIRGNQQIHPPLNQTCTP